MFLVPRKIKAIEPVIRPLLLAIKTAIVLSVRTTQTNEAANFFTIGTLELVCHTLVKVHVISRLHFAILRCNNMKIVFLNAMYCEEETVDLFYKYDFVVVNCGHHPASSKHFKFFQYRETVNKFFARLKGYLSKRRKTKKVIWIENVAIPLHQDEGVISNRDWRTYHRLLLFTDIAQNAIFKSGVPVQIVPAFQLTLAAFDKYCDCTHYPSAGREPILLTLLDKLTMK